MFKACRIHSSSRFDNTRRGEGKEADLRQWFVFFFNVSFKKTVGKVFASEPEWTEKSFFIFFFFFFTQRRYSQRRKLYLGTKTSSDFEMVCLDFYVFSPFFSISFLLHWRCASIETKDVEFKINIHIEM